jgi:hypothetical protein
MSSADEQAAVTTEHQRSPAGRKLVTDAHGQPSRMVDERVLVAGPGHAGLGVIEIATGEHDSAIHGSARAKRGVKSCLTQRFGSLGGAGWCARSRGSQPEIRRRGDHAQQAREPTGQSHGQELMLLPEWDAPVQIASFGASLGGGGGLASIARTGRRVCVAAIGQRAVEDLEMVRRLLTALLSDPDADVRGLEGFAHGVHVLVLDRGEIDGIAHVGTEALECRLGVVAGAVEAPVDEALDAPAQRVEQRDALLLGRARSGCAGAARPRQLIGLKSTC